MYVTKNCKDPDFFPVVRMLFLLQVLKVVLKIQGTVKVFR